jgi:OOP family OmpA-OmpF porin
MILAALALAALVVPARTRAASDLPWSISALGGYARYSDRWFFPADSLADAPVFGARLGRHFGEIWTLEAAGSYGKTHGVRRDGSDAEDVTVMNGSLSLMARLTPPNALGSLYLLGGMGYTSYDADVTDNEYHYGVLEGALGWTKSMNDHWSLRLEARNLLNLPKSNYGTANKADQQFWGGLTYDFGGKPKDSDGDGVYDKKDKCPDTPKGATVDANGCPSDSDGDGVWNGIDQCPDTPKGATVDAKGCPTDSDGDGVFDGIDQCPDTPKGATVDAKGCPSDSDGDGVWDGIDQCPNTPKGATVDATGCPKDSDGDGVFDGIDQCPNTPAGLKVDANGCPIEITEKETELFDTGMIRLQNVNFETGKADLLPESFNALDQVGVILSKWPQLKIEVGGHTDSRDSERKNQVLSEARAQSVKDYLTGHFSGIQADQLTVKGYGESKPLVRNTSKLNMAKNRRVEFKVLNRDVLKKEIERRRMLTK